MQWIILLAVLGCLLWALKPPKPFPAFPPARDQSPLSEYMASAARAAEGKGRARLRLSRRVSVSLEKNLSRLLALPPEQLLPASGSLCRQARFLQKEAFEALDDPKGIPSLPRASARQPRVCLFAQAWIHHSDAALTPADAAWAVQAWQQALPLTVDELEALPAVLRTELIRLLAGLAQQCVQHQRLVRQAAAVRRLVQAGKLRQARRMALAVDHPVFLEQLLHMEEGAAFAASLGLDEASVLSESNAQQAQTSRWIQNALASLDALRHASWKPLLEALSPVHTALSADPVYLSMTARSRALYRTRTAAIARKTKRSEEAVASAVLALCQSAQSGTVQAHTGYYLIDDGLPALLRQLCGRRVRFPIRRSRAAIASLQLEQLDEDSAALVVCTAVLPDASAAIAAVKHLSILEKANQDPHLHFLLLGESPDGLHDAHGSGADAIPAAAAAVEALCAASGHRFFYFHRDRTCLPGAHAGLCSISRLICGKAAGDHYAFTSAEPASLCGRYRFLIPLRTDMLLPPGSALKMVGALLHPLNRRCRLGHVMRGAGMLQPRIQSAPHQLQSRLSALLRHSFRGGFYTGAGIVDPAVCAASEAHLSPALFGALNGCRFLPDVTLYAPEAQTLEEALARVHQRVEDAWALLPLLIGLRRADQPRRMPSPAVRARLWLRLPCALLPFWQLTALLALAAGGHPWLFALLLCLGGPLHAAMLPCTACVCLTAALRTLWRAFAGHEPSLRWSLFARRRAADRPPMLFFSLSMGCAGLSAALTLLPFASGAACWTGAALWALFGFFVPWLEQSRVQRPLPTPYMREVLLRTARHTLAFFETAITPSDHALPPDNVQIDPNKGIAHHTSPEAIGLYLCALISAQKLGLIGADDMAQRMGPCLHALETLPKWKGLPFERYDTQTLKPLSAFVRTQGCGMLLVSLITCAQGIRSLPAAQAEELAGLAIRMDALSEAMQVEALYDPSAELFRRGIHTAPETPDPAFEDLLASPGRLLSFAAIMLGRVPSAHWQALARPGRRQALLSRSGGMDEYFLPLLFQPAVQGTLLDAACRKALALQKRCRLGGAYGVSSGACCAFEADLHYQRRSFGLPALALSTDADASLLTPYAAFLALPADPKASFVNLQRLERLGLQGPLGFFEAADFSHARTGGDGMAIVRCHTAHHQAIILCAVCNALCSQFLPSLFSGLPSAQAYQLLLEEPPPARLRRARRPLCARQTVENPAAALMQREGSPLQFPIDAHVLSGDRTCWLIDAQGGGYIRQDGMWLTRFRTSCATPSGMRIYLRDSHTGACWQAADPRLCQSVRFETSQAVFRHTRFDVACEMRMWVNPLDGSAIHWITLNNQSRSERVMELCSYAEPAFEVQRTGRLSRSGVFAQSKSDPSVQLWHLLTTDKELSLLRIQCDAASFPGRGRTFHAPRALELPISAVADTLGESAVSCLTLRAQFALRAGETASFGYVTHLAGDMDSADAFCERCAKADAVYSTSRHALTSSALAARSLSIPPERQAFYSHLVGALAYTGQPFQGGDAPGQRLEQLHAFGLDASQPFLLAECRADTDAGVLEALLEMHAFLHMSGFTYDLVFALCVRTRASAARDAVEAAISQSHSQQWRNQRGGVWVLERTDEQELALLRCAARLIFQTDLPLEKQFFPQRLDAPALYQTSSATQWKPRLPQGAELLLPNGFGGVTVPEGHYQITLAPGMHTPAAWRSPLCSHSGSTLAGESGLEGGEAFFLRDEENHLLWSPTRQPLGQSVPVRITHAPGETIYESSGFGLYVRICCFADVEHPAGLRLIHLKNEDETARTIRLVYACLLPDQARLEIQDGCVCGWNPVKGQYALLFALEAAGCQPSVLSTGLFQGLWEPVPFALSAPEIPSCGGSAGLLSFPLEIGAGASADVVCGLAHAGCSDELPPLLHTLRQCGASNRLHTARAFWQKQLDVFHFDLPDPALSVLLSRWLPFQALASAMRTSSASPLLAFTDPTALQQRLAALAAHAHGQALAEKLQLLYAVSYCAEISGDTAFLREQTDGNGTLLQRCLSLMAGIAAGPHQLPCEGGETVWHGMFLCEILRRFIPLCSKTEQQQLKRRRARLLEALDRDAWEGTWYLYGWEADGSPAGGGRRLDLITQCWAVMCGVSRNRCEIAMENVWRMLYRRETGTFRPCLSPETDAAQNALHAFWASAALHQLGMNKRAWAAAEAALPLFRSSTRQQAARYRAEPYALAETLNAAGQGQNVWQWSEAGWCWCLITEQLLGVRKQGCSLRFVPTVPAAWEQVHLTYRFGSATYHLHASRSCLRAAADGQPLPDGRLRLTDDGKIHEAFFPLR